MSNATPAALHLVSSDPNDARPRLSAVVCARNEEARLAACLQALRFADEIVVVLDRSTDASSTIAQATADRVLEGEFPLEGMRRAAAQDACTGSWVLEVDADELVPEDLALDIRRLLDNDPDADWYILRFDNYIGQHLVRHGWGGSFGTSTAARLYRRGGKTWGSERVHPAVQLAGRCGGILPQAIRHGVDSDISDMLRRLDHYTRLRAADLRDTPRLRRGLWSHVFRGVRRFWKCYVTRRGYREGNWGVLIALMAALYPGLSELRARLEQGSGSPDTAAERPVEKAAA